VLQEISPKRGLFSDPTIEGPVSTNSSTESSLAGASQFLNPGLEIEILAPFLNSLNG